LKSRAQELHPDAVNVVEEAPLHDDQSEEQESGFPPLSERVHFETFVGIGPNRYDEFFGFQERKRPPRRAGSESTPPESKWLEQFGAMATESLSDEAKKSAPLRDSLAFAAKLGIDSFRRAIESQEAAAIRYLEANMHSLNLHFDESNDA
jgi:hypothetical protein